MEFLCQVIEKKVETETVITTSKTIKYSTELATAKQGTPNASSEKLQTKPSEPQPKVEDVPPKPPPRTFPVLEIQKKESDSSKSATLILEHSKPTPPEPAIKHFEFPEVLNLTSRPPKSEHVTENSMRSFEPKMASTPTSKNEKMDFGESETNAVKSASVIENNKAVAESKVSPTNSVVRAMIYTNKNKGGSKKKNTLVASMRLFKFCLELH